MSPSYNVDGLTSGTITHLGAGTCAVLNVNAGSKAYVRPGGLWPMDLCWFNGELHAAHIEGDKNQYFATVFSGESRYQQRGPYVQKWDGTNWTLLGGNVNPATDALPSGVGDRCLSHNVRLATDGTDLYIAYFDFVITSTSPVSYQGHIRIAKWNGASWTELASEAIQGGGDGSFGGSIPSLTIAGGKAYVVYSTNNFRRVRIFRSDGTGDFVAGSGNAYVGYSQGPGDGTYAAVTTTAGRPVGVYSKALQDFVGSLVMFDLDTAAVIRETPTPLGPSALVPYGTNTLGGILSLTGVAYSGYDTDKIIMGEQKYGFIVIPEDGSSDFTTLTGDMSTSSPLFSMFGHFAMDPADPNKRQLWMSEGTNGDEFATFINTDQRIFLWRPACGTQFSTVVSTPLNVDPTYALSQQTQVPIDVNCLFANDRFWGQWGPVIVAVDDTYLYVFWLYEPGDDSGDDGSQPFWFQFVVSRFTILRNSPCTSFNSATFSSRFKAAD